jgi:L-fucose mutarotase/ribose pyranase (RbsD/FucU family)
MLKRFPVPMIPDALHTLSSMGHGDEIAVGSVAQGGGP